MALDQHGYKTVVSVISYDTDLIICVVWDVHTSKNGFVQNNTVEEFLFSPILL